MESEFKSFENQWNEALRDASVPPPDFVWDNIEKELDQKKKKRVAFLWWKNPALLSGIAAALVLGLTVLFINKNKTGTEVADLPKNNIVGPSQKSLKSSSEIVSGSEFSISSKASKDIKNLAELSPKYKSAFANSLFAKKKSLKESEQQDLITGQSVNSVTEINPANPQIKEVFLAENSNTILAVDKINQRGFKEIRNRFQPFRSHIAVEFEETIVETKSKENKFWFGLNSGVAPFNPNFENAGFTGEALASVRSDAAFSSKSAEQAMSPSNTVSGTNTANYLPNGMPESSFKNGTAVNFGFAVGKKLKKRWGIESGFRFMQASAFLNTNVYSIEENTGKVNSYFHTNYLDSESESTQTVLSINASSKQLYNYINVPLLLNYSVPVIKNLNLEALSGVSGDLFVFGKSDAGQSNSASLTAANSTFNLLNFSGMGGLRINYVINKNWEANMGSTYQQALTSGVSNERNLSFKPRTFGLNYGVRYKIK
jgi:hypothetical protein